MHNPLICTHIITIGFKVLRGKQVCVILAGARIFSWKNISHIQHLHYSESSVYLSVYLYILLQLWGMINISFQPQALFTLSTSRNLWWALPRASILAETCAYMHRCAHMFGHTLCHATHTSFTTWANTAGPTNRSPQSSKLPAAPCLVQLPLWAMFIYNRACVTDSINTHRNSTLQERMHYFICVSVTLVTSQYLVCVSAGLILSQSLPHGATYPSWSVSGNWEIQSSAYHMCLCSL